MRRTLASAACALVVVAAVAFGQGRLTTDSGGIIGGNPPQPGGAIGATPPSRFVTNYTFEGSPLLTSNGTSTQAGWYKLSSSNLSEITGAAPCITSSASPCLLIEMQAGGAYQNLSEHGFNFNGGGDPMISQQRSGEYKVAFNLWENQGAPLGGDDEVFQITVGDTSFVKFQKKPTGFGLVYFGSDSAGAANPGGGFVTKPADWPTDTWIGFVGNGTDTTYKPLLAYPQHKNLPHNLVFLIYAAPNNGPVTFYINGVARGTISDVTRDTAADRLGFNLTFTGGDTNQPEARLGPLSIERSY